METLTVFSTESPFCIVSNPLGWDGDFNFNAAAGLIKLVSNPLGWDGDRRDRR